jgi:hypothetical protein
MRIITTAKQVIKDLEKYNKRQRTQVAIALTKTALIAKNKNYQQMKKVFDRPTPSTLNSLYIKPAKENNLEAIVGIKQFQSKGKSAADYLDPQIVGGGRKQKRSERLLTDKGILPAGMNLLPGAGIKLDRYGNVPKGAMTQMLSILRSHTEVGFKANTTIESKKRNKKLKDLFVYKGDRMAKGVYIRLGKRGIKPYMMFGRSAKYRKRYSFEQTTKETYNNYFDRELNNVKNS